MRVTNTKPLSAGDILLALADAKLTAARAEKRGDSEVVVAAKSFITRLQYNGLKPAGRK